MRITCGEESTVPKGAVPPWSSFIIGAVLEGQAGM